jgi:hypothetical protein
MAEQVTFHEFLDLVLTALYELDQSEPDELFDVNEIAAAASKRLEQEIPENWAFDAVKVLDDLGLIVGLRAFGGVAEGSLTGAGGWRSNDVGSGSRRRRPRGLRSDQKRLLPDLPR